MLPVVLVVENNLQLPQPLLKGFRCRVSLRLASVGIAAPVEVGAGQVFVRCPVLGFDQPLQPRPVGSGFRTKHSIARSHRRLLWGEPLLFPRRGFLPHPSRQGILVSGFGQIRHRRYRLIKQINQIGEGIPEKARNPQGHIHPGPS